MFIWGWTPGATWKLLFSWRCECIFCNDFDLSAVIHVIHLHCADFVVACWDWAFVCSQLKLKLKMLLIKSSWALRGKASALPVSHDAVYLLYGHAQLRKQLSDPIVTVVRGYGRAATSDWPKEQGESKQHQEWESLRGKKRPISTSNESPSGSPLIEAVQGKQPLIKAFKRK